MVRMLHPQFVPQAQRDARRLARHGPVSPVEGAPTDQHRSGRRRRGKVKMPTFSFQDRMEYKDGDLIVEVLADNVEDAWLHGHSSQKTNKGLL